MFFGGNLPGSPVVKTALEAWVQSLVRELRSHKPRLTAKKKKRSCVFLKIAVGDFNKTLSKYGREKNKKRS